MQPRHPRTHKTQINQGRRHTIEQESWTLDSKLPRALQTTSQRHLNTREKTLQNHLQVLELVTKASKCRTISTRHSSQSILLRQQDTHESHHIINTSPNLLNREEVKELIPIKALNNLTIAWSSDRVTSPRREL